MFFRIDPTTELNGALLWHIPIGRLAYGGDLKRSNALIALQHTKMAQFRSQVNEEILMARELMIVAKEQMDISREGSSLAEQALIQSVQRQELGTVRPFEILQAQEVFIKSKLDYLKAVSSYNKAQYDLYVARGNNL